MTPMPHNVGASHIDPQAPKGPNRCTFRRCSPGAIPQSVELVASCGYPSNIYYHTQNTIAIPGNPAQPMLQLAVILIRLDLFRFVQHRFQPIASNPPLR